MVNVSYPAVLVELALMLSLSSFSDISILSSSFFIVFLITVSSVTNWEIDTIMFLWHINYYLHFCVI